MYHMMNVRRVGLKNNSKNSYLSQYYDMEIKHAITITDGSKYTLQKSSNDPYFTSWIIFIKSNVRGTGDDPLTLDK